jgi:hypothetical protein
MRAWLSQSQNIRPNLGVRDDLETEARSHLLLISVRCHVQVHTYRGVRSSDVDLLTRRVNDTLVWKSFVIREHECQIGINRRHKSVQDGEHDFCPARPIERRVCDD